MFLFWHPIISISPVGTGLKWTAVDLQTSFTYPEKVHNTMLTTEYLTYLERCMEKQYFARVEKDPIKSNMFIKIISHD